jgi:hypothetical protein
VDSAKTLKKRVEALQERSSERARTVNDLADAYNNAHDGARDSFFLPFVQSTRQIKGVPARSGKGGIAVVGTPAEQRLRVSVDGLAKSIQAFGEDEVDADLEPSMVYGELAAATAFEAATAGGELPNLAAIASAGAGLAYFGASLASGAGLAGGALMLAGLVAAPAAVLALGGYMWIARRSKQKEAEILISVEEAEQYFDDTQRGFDDLCATLPKATKALEDIAVHGSRALSRWLREVGPFPTSWIHLSKEHRQRHEDFLRIAACQLTAARIQPAAFISLRDAPLEALTAITEQDLAYVQNQVDLLL